MWSGLERTVLKMILCLPCAVFISMVKFVVKFTCD